MVIEIRFTVNGEEKIFIIRNGTQIGFGYYVSNKRGLRLTERLKSPEDAFAWCHNHVVGKKKCPKCGGTDLKVHSSGMADECKKCGASFVLT